MDKSQVSSRLNDTFSQQYEILRRIIEQYDFDLRCAAPGIIQSWDANQQTVSVQLSIKDLIYVEKLESIAIPILEDVPIVVPRAGNFVITIPPKKGDECLVIFADTCIDSWWYLGEEKDNPNNFGARDPLSIRRHDLSDAFAILGTWSQPNKIENYSEDSLEIRTLDGKTSVSIKDDKIVITENSTYVEIKDGEVIVKSDAIKLGDVSGLRRLIDERIVDLINNHTHLYNAGPVTGQISGVPIVPIQLDSCATEVTEAK